jgi:hypothetical protein
VSVGRAVYESPYLRVCARVCVKSMLRVCAFI